jgi:DNA-binding LacI/PurR family transcriptional regulator
MATVLEKNGRTGLARQIQKIILKRIKDGVYRPGERLDSIRVLAGEFKVSKNTVVEAFRGLEERHCVEKIPARGIFVVDKSLKPTETLNIILPFPEATFSIKNLPGDNLGTVMDVFQGLTEGAGQHNCRIHFFHCDESLPIKEQVEEFKALSKIDGAIFIGHQLKELRQHFLNEEKPVILLHHSDNDGCSFIRHDIESNMAKIVALLADRNYRKIGILAAEDNRSESILKLECLRQHLLRRKMEYQSEWEFRFAWAPGKSHYEALNAQLSTDLNELPEVFFSDRISFVKDLYRIAGERGWKIGQDIGVIGHASRLGYINMHPSMTYLELPHYEQGIRAIEMISDIINGKTNSPTNISLAGAIHIGESIRK